MDWTIHRLHYNALRAFSKEGCMDGRLVAQIGHHRAGHGQRDGAGFGKAWICGKCFDLGETFSWTSIFLDGSDKKQDWSP